MTNLERVIYRVVCINLVPVHVIVHDYVELLGMEAFQDFRSYAVVERWVDGG